MREHTKGDLEWLYAYVAELEDLVEPEDISRAVERANAAASYEEEE